MDNQNFSEQINEPIKFKGVGQLFKETWQIYRSKIKILLGMMAVCYFVYLIAGFLMGILVWQAERMAMAGKIGAIMGMTILFLMILFVSLLLAPSLLYAIKDSIGIKEAFKKGFKIIIPYVWIAFLVGFITIGGFVFLIIPGILFSIWLGFATYILVFEGRKGMSAILRSKDLVSGKWWSVFWRFLAISLILIGIILIIFIPIFFLLWATGNIDLAEPIVDAVNYIIQFFVTPFSLIYGVLIYKNLRDIKKEIPYQEPTSKRKIKYILIGAIGFALLLGMMAWLMWALFSTF